MPHPGPARARRWLVAGVAVAALATACSAENHPAVVQPSTTAPSVSTPTVTATAKPTPTPTPSPTGPPRHPFSGRTSGRLAGPVVVVKIDNVAPARPQTGLGAADLIYLEPVESGLTRLAAVFSSTLPRLVGPVRSARASDVELFAQFGRVAFAYSGANPGVQRIVAAAPLYDFDEVTGGSAFRRSARRPRPHNLYVDPVALLRRAPGASRAHDVGFRFGAPPPGGRRVTSVTTRWQRAQAEFRWSGSARRWLWSMDGVPQTTTDGVRVGASTVLVQYVTVTPSRFRDVTGARSPTIRTVGSGTGLLLRDGRAWAVQWSRRTAVAGTRWTIGGANAALAPGQVWVVLMDRRTRATLR